ncbi:MAG: amidohydrolase family protein, partial [Chloroflexi bacterium]|nr:amidohydrolase family protein [Chloroflexota bacterium]
IVVCHCGGGLDRFLPSDGHLPQEDLSKNLFFDTCAYNPIFLEAAIKQRGVKRMLFGTEAPGSGRHVNPETGKSGDHIVEVLDGFSFLTDADRKAIMHDQPLAFCSGFEKLK